MKRKTEVKTLEILFEMKEPSVGVLKICSKFTGEHPCRNVISTWVLSYKFAAFLQNNFSSEHLWRLRTAASEKWKALFLKIYLGIPKYLSKVKFPRNH